MTSPQDPNQPGWASPQDPNQPGWASPPGNPPQGYPPQQPGWGPPQQPGWGPPQQPGWGPPQQPGWGPPQGNQPQWGSGAPQGWNSQSGSSNRKGCLIAVVVVVALIGVLVVGCAVTLLPALTTGMAIENASGGKITSMSYNWNNGTGEFTFTVAAGVSAEEARTIVCQVVEPKLKGTQFQGTHFLIVDQGGYELASDQTTCP
jgi:hypothetical protein